MDTKDLKIAVAGTGYVGLSYSNAFGAASLGDGSRCALVPHV